MSDTTTSRPHLTLVGAQSVIAAARAQAAAMGIPVSIAVVDHGGALLSFVRMDGAAFASVELAIDKAHSAAGFGYPTEDFFALIKDDVSLLHGLTTHGRLALFAGGAPIMVDGAVAGALGVSGGRGVDDVEVVKAGLGALS
ncbi:MAG TPA: heme-binding protein [Solirubrobacteraceae bacterium]|nr:heme-binding protein [Solirubrobacteraceae bacterium]